MYFHNAFVVFVLVFSLSLLKNRDGSINFASEKKFLFVVIKSGNESNDTYKDIYSGKEISLQRNEEIKAM